METQMVRCTALVEPLYVRAHPQHQLTYEVEDADMLCDAIKLTFSYLFCFSGTQLRLDTAWKDWVEVRLYCIVRVFFRFSEWDEWPSVGRLRASGKGPNSEMVAGATSNGGGATDDLDATASSSTPRSAALGGVRNGTLLANFSGDLWKSLLKSEQAKFTRG